MDSQTSLRDLLSCARLRRYSNFAWQTRKHRIGIPLSPEADVNNIAADLVLLILQNVIPRKLMRSYLIQIISHETVAAILRGWRDATGQNIMHLAAAQYDIDFIELLVEKCGEDLLTTASHAKINPLPLCNAIGQNPMIAQYDQTYRTIEYYISKVPNALSWLRSALFQNLGSFSASHPRKEFLRAVFDRPIVASEMTDHEKSTVKAFFVRRGNSLSHITTEPDLQRKFLLLFFLSEPSLSECKKSSALPDRNRTYQEPKAIQKVMNLFEEVKKMKQLTADQGMLVALTLMLMDALNDKSRQTGRQHISLLWTLNDCGALPKTLQEAIDAKEGDIATLLAYLSEKSTLLQLYKIHFLENDVPPIIADVMKMNLKSWFSAPTFGFEISTKTIEFPLLDLPFDIVTTICSFLPYKDSISFSLINKQLGRLTKTSTIWSAKFEQYFPHDQTTKDYSQTSFCRRYKNKFEATQIAGDDYAFSSNHRYAVPWYCDMYSTELHQHEFLYSSKHHNRLTLLDMSTKKHVSVENFEPVVARMHQDRVIVMKHKQVEVRNKLNLEVLSEFPRSNFPSTKLPYFAVSNNWLICSDRFYDWTTGQTLNSWPQHQQTIVVRDHMSYGISGSDILIRDLRQANQIHQTVSIANVDKSTAMNVVDGKIYTAGQSIDIFDTRYLQTSLSSVTSRNIGSCDTKDRYAIDLVNMNVWGSQISWDLIDNKWEQPNVNDYPICPKVCNGKYLAVLFLGILVIYELTGSTPFPYGDLQVRTDSY